MVMDDHEQTKPYSTEQIMAMFEGRYGRPIKDPWEFYIFCGAERIRLFLKDEDYTTLDALWVRLNGTESPWREYG